MSEYELLDALNSTVDLIISTFSVYVGVTSAYLVCAFVVGSRLGSWQCTVITVLYVVSASVGITAMFFMGTTASDLADQLAEVSPGKLYGMQLMVRNILTAVCIAGIPACLKFMWDTRYGQAEIDTVTT